MSHQAIGDSLRITEAAAQKRVIRAVGRLRKRLGSAAALLTVPAVATLFSERATHAASSQLAPNTLAALHGSLPARSELILKGMSAMKTALVAKISAAAIVVVLLASAAAFAINAAHCAPSNPLTPITVTSAPAFVSLPSYNLATVQTIRASFLQNGITHTNWYSREKGVVEQFIGHDWSVTQFTLRAVQCSYREGATLILKKKPAQNSDAMMRKVESDITSLQHASAVREPATDTAIDNMVCQAYRLKDGPGQGKNVVVYINPTTHRPARMTSDEPRLDMTFSYDPTIADNLFKLPATPNTQIVNAHDYFEKKYPLDSALFTKEDIGQIFAVHEAVQDANGYFHLICSCRIAPRFRPAIADLPDDENLNMFMMDDLAELPFRYLRIAEFHESGIRVMYVIAVPDKTLAPENICQLPVTMASPASILKIAHSDPPQGNNGGRDVHFPVSLEVKVKPNPPTPRTFTARAYDEVMPIAGIVPETYFIGPGTGADISTISTKEQCLADMDKKLANLLSDDPKNP